MDVAREGAPQRTEADASKSVQDQTGTRVRELYLDLTNSQIAWKIARRVQQDIPQLPKG